MIRLTAATFPKEPQTKRALLSFIAKAKQLSFGVECRAFEKGFAKWQGKKDAVFMNSGSTANMALFQALINTGRLKKGDRVAFSSVTWSTNVMPLIALGLVPIPMDVALETFNTPPNEVEKAIRKSKVRAVFITNLLGFSHNLHAIRVLCKKSNVLLLEDNCESLGSKEGGVKLGNFGLASTFSFYVGHHLSTIEGGMVVTDDTGLANALRVVRAHGWDRQLERTEQKALRKRHHVDSFYGSYTFYDIGYNFRPMEIQGFIGNAVLPYADSIVKDREKIFSYFETALKKRSDAYLPMTHTHLKPFSAFALPVICKTQTIRKKLLAATEGRIETRPIVGGNIASQPFFKKYMPSARKKYPTPNADRIHKLGLYLPLRPDLTRKEMKAIHDAILSV